MFLPNCIFWRWDEDRQASLSLQFILYNNDKTVHPHFCFCPEQVFLYNASKPSRMCRMDQELSPWNWIIFRTRSSLYVQYGSVFDSSHELTPQSCMAVLWGCSLSLPVSIFSSYFPAFRLNYQPWAKTSFFNSLSARRMLCCSNRGFWGNTNFMLYSSVVPYKGLVRRLLFWCLSGTF